MTENIEIKNNEILKVTLKKFSKKFVYFSIFLFFIIIFSFYFIFLKIPSDFPQGKIINIKEGASLRSISKELEKENIIHSRPIFEAFVVFYGGEKHLILGEYLFEEKVRVYEIARRISVGEKHLAPIKITIPEGFTKEEIALLAENKLSYFDRNNFLNKTKEGYLFPDTYFFLTTDTENDVLERLNDNFLNKTKTLKTESEKLGKNFQDIIIMASIIEREAKGDTDREAISSILWKRINIGMPLQADAAPITYKEKGLPKEPIANPGLASIKASLYPKSSPYLFYLHDKEGNIYFAKTFTEHQKNIQKYLR